MEIKIKDLEIKMTPEEFMSYNGDFKNLISNEMNGKIE